MPSRFSGRLPGDVTGPVAGEGQPASPGRTATAIQGLSPGYFPLRHGHQHHLDGTWWIPLLVVLGIWRHVRHRWPLTYEPALWSVVFPLGMYSVATLTFGQAAHLAFTAPLSGFMLWVALAAWVAVAGVLAVQAIMRWSVPGKATGAAAGPEPSR